jgi:hypothetical protein
VDTLSSRGRHTLAETWPHKMSHLKQFTQAVPAHSLQICLEEQVWNAACYWSRNIEYKQRVVEDAAVNEVVDSSGVQYAVIAGLRTETGSERLVIAYPNETSLRDLIAAPSIIAVGFSSREEAVAGGRACVPTAASYQRMPEATADRGTERYQQRLNCAERRGANDSALRGLTRFLVTSFSDVVTSATVIFSSRNAVSTVIRMALGSSV